MAKILNSIHPNDNLHYEKMGLNKEKVEIWEDELRTSCRKEEYEWWYFDKSSADIKYKSKKSHD